MRLQVGLCFTREDGTIMAVRTLKVSWSPSATKALKKIHGIDASDEIIELLCTEIRRSDLKSVVQELIKETEAQPDVSTGLGLNPSEPQGLGGQTPSASAR